MAEPLIPGGYILLSRKLIESEIFKKPPLYSKVWIYLLARAQHGDYKQLKRGELRTSISEIQEACSWTVGFRKETPTKKQIYSIIEWLRNPYEKDNERNAKETMIVTTKGTQGMVISIVNFNYYQNSKNYERNNEGDNEKSTKEQRAEQQGNNTNKNDKNVKNDKNDKEDISIDDDEEKIPDEKPKKPKPKKDKYGEFEKVSLTADEFNKLINKLGQSKTKEMISRLDSYKASTGKKYDSDYATILNWIRKDEKEAKENLNTNAKQGKKNQQSNLSELLEMINGGAFDE